MNLALPVAMEGHAALSEQHAALACCHLTICKSHPSRARANFSLAVGQFDVAKLSYTLSLIFKRMQNVQLLRRTTQQPAPGYYAPS